MLFSVGIIAVSYTHLDVYKRQDEVGLVSIVCADSIAEAAAIAHFAPNIIVAEPTELIGTGQTSDEEYVLMTTAAIKAVNPEIQVLQGAGISTYSSSLVCPVPMSSVGSATMIFGAK